MSNNGLPGLEEKGGNNLKEVEKEVASDGVCAAFGTWIPDDFLAGVPSGCLDNQVAIRTPRHRIL